MHRDDRLVWFVAGLAVVMFVAAINWQTLVDANMNPGGGSDLIVELPPEEEVVVPDDPGTVENETVVDVFTVEIYLNISSVDWGSLSPGETATRGLLIKNLGNASVTLGFQTVDWSSAAAQQYLNFTWSYAGEILEPEEELPESLILSVDPLIKDVDEFSFGITLTAEQA